MRQDVLAIHRHGHDRPCGTASAPRGNIPVPSTAPAGRSPHPAHAGAGRRTPRPRPGCLFAGPSRALSPCSGFSIQSGAPTRQALRGKRSYSAGKSWRVLEEKTWFPCSFFAVRQKPKNFLDFRNFFPQLRVLILSIGTRIKELDRDMKPCPHYPRHRADHCSDCTRTCTNDSNRSTHGTKRGRAADSRLMRHNSPPPLSKPPTV